MPITFTTITASAASMFLNSIGINGDANATSASRLQYLGIDHLRAGPAAPAQMLAAGANGARIDVLVPWFLHPITSSNLTTMLLQIDSASPVIEAFEGPNEVNFDPDIYNGLTGAAGIDAEQRDLYRLVKADTNLNNAAQTTTVLNFTVLQGTPPTAYGNLSAAADYDNIHVYGNAGAQPAWMLPTLTTTNLLAPSKPLVITETGATTIQASGVDQATQARYDIDALLDAFQLGVKRTYLYNLQDWASGTNIGNFSAYFGLYDTDSNIKLAGTTMHNFTTVLSQNNSGSTSTATLAYSLTGAAYYGNSEVLAKPNGIFDVVLWNETNTWNASTDSEIAIPTNDVTLTLGSTYQTIAVYDPLQSASPIATASNASTITVGLNADPLIIEVTPPMSVGSGAANLVLQVSEDAFDGNAQFTVGVDGVQVGGVMTATASHSAGQSQSVNVLGSFNDGGTHAVTVSFLNDLYKSGVGDRNLFVSNATLDGTVLPGGKLTFLNAGSQTISVSEISP